MTPPTELKVSELEYDYDFTIYDDGENIDDEVESDLSKPQPKIKALRSRFSNGEAELMRLAELSVLMSRFAIKVESKTQDINELWHFFGILNEFWESIKNIFGSVVMDDVLQIKNHCLKLLNETGDEIIDTKVHNNLLFYRSQLYRLKQQRNLGFEVEKMSGGTYQRAKNSIIQ